MGVESQEEIIIVPVVPKEEPLARLLHVGLAVGREDLRHLRLHLTEGNLTTCFPTVP